MNAELEAIKEAISPHDPEAGPEGMDHATAKSLSNAYVAAHPEQFAKFAGKSLPEIVEMIDKLRDLGWDEDMWIAEAWHLHTWKPQEIGGVMGPEQYDTVEEA